ncbi:hypothetical protein JAMGFMIE_04148 [Rheinheimera sp. MM224]|nr:hypothetical protein JAMGFMIE_04148 [Rheinheimera sp. MM224]
MLAAPLWPLMAALLPVFGKSLYQEQNYAVR